MILIGITTYNRPERLGELLNALKKYPAPSSRIVVVDDNSIPDLAKINAALCKKYKNVTYIYNEANVGIAQSKNRCIAEIDEKTQYIFLFDDDVFPTKKGWAEFYIFCSGLAEQEHLTLTFDKLANGTPNGNKLLGQSKGIEYYSNPCGVLLFFTRKCIDRIGGFDIRYHKWGHEHVGHSRRIHNAGLTTKPFLSPLNSLSYFYPHDYYQSAKSAVDTLEKRQALIKNTPVLQEEQTSGERKPYARSNFIVSAYLNSQLDPQRNVRFKADTSELKLWIDSATAKGLKVYLFSDCFKSKDFDNPNVYVEPVKQPNNLNIYLYRWMLYYKFMQRYRPYINGVFFTDSTDVTVLNNPFEDIAFNPERIYLGDEPCKIGIPWMQNQIRMLPPQNMGKNWMQRNGHQQLINAGVCGGKYETLLPFVKSMSDECSNLYGNRVSDMPIINYVAYMLYAGQYEHGRKVTTVFKSFDEANTTAWFRHK